MMHPAASPPAAVPLVVVLVALLSSGGARAAAFEPADTSWEGTSELYALCKQRLGSRVSVEAILDWGALAPSDAVVVLHPTVNIDYSEASAFLRAGGRVAILDDFGEGARFLQRFQIRRVRAPNHPSRSLRDNANLAVAVPAIQYVAGQEQGRHPMVAEVSELFTNHPSALTHPDLTPVLTIPAVGEPEATLAVTGIIANRGRLFAMADPSAVINLMLAYPGNRAFAEGLVDYLLEDDTWGRRGGRLYLVANGFEQQGHYGGEGELAQQLQERLLGAMDAAKELHDDGLPPLAALLLAVASAVGAMLWVGLQSARPYRRVLPRYARPVPEISQGGAVTRAAILRAPTTRPVLALVELKLAFERAIAERLGLRDGASSAAILEEIDRQGLLSRRSSDRLRRSLSELARVEASLGTNRAQRVGRRTLARARSETRELLDELERALPNSRR